MEERVKRVLGTIETEEIGDTTNLILAGAMVVTERLGLKSRNRESTGNKGTNKEGAKKIIEKGRELCRKDLSRNKEIEKSRTLVTKDHYLDRKYGIVEKGTPVI